MRTQRTNPTQNTNASLDAPNSIQFVEGEQPRTTQENLDDGGERVEYEGLEYEHPPAAPKKTVTIADEPTRTAPTPPPTHMTGNKAQPSSKKDIQVPSGKHITSAQDKPGPTKTTQRVIDSERSEAAAIRKTR